MEIPTDGVTREFFEGRISQVTRLQRRWTHWAASNGTGHPLPSKSVARQSESPTLSSRLKLKPSVRTPLRPRVVRPSSAGSCCLPPHSTPEPSCFSSELPSLDAESFIFSSYGVSKREIALLKGLCDALAFLSSHGRDVTSSTLSPQFAPTDEAQSAMSVEVVMSALEACCSIFAEHPLFSFLFQQLASWVPRGAYVNPLPVLSDVAEAPPECISDAEAPAALSLWTKWLLERGQQWSRLCTTHGATTHAFQSSRENASTSPEVLGEKLFGSDHQGVHQHTFKRKDQGEPVTYDLRVTILRSHLRSWRQFTNDAKRFRTCVEVCHRSGHKDTLETAFMRWKMYTTLSLSDRRVGHAERLHFVVTENERKLNEITRDLRDARRQRDVALSSIDQLHNNTKLSIEKVRDLQNAMVIDFRRPIFQNSSRTGDPLVEGVVYFRHDPQPSGVVVGQCRPGDGDTQCPAVLPSYVNDFGATKLPIDFSFDFGKERPSEGVALPNASAYHSYYSIRAEGLTQQQQQTGVAPVSQSQQLMQWLNDEVLSFLESEYLLMERQCKLSGMHRSSSTSAQLRSNSSSTDIVSRYLCDAFGELGIQYSVYLQDWQERLKSWYNEAQSLRDCDKEVENVCLVTSVPPTANPTASSGRVKCAFSGMRSLNMSCHVRRGSDLRRFPYLYALLIVKYCPMIVYQWYASEGSNRCLVAEDADSSPLLCNSGTAGFEDLLSTDDDKALKKGKRSNVLIACKDEMLSRFLKESTTMRQILPFLRFLGVLQHIPEELIAGRSTAKGSVTSGDDVVSKESDAAHLLVLARVRAYAVVRNEFAAYWQASSLVPLKQGLSLEDMVLQLDGPSHGNEVCAREVLSWVRKVLLDERYNLQALELEKALAAQAAHEEDECKRKEASLSPPVSVRQRSGVPVTLNRATTSGRFSFVTRQAATKPAAAGTASKDPPTSSVMCVDDLSASFGDGLELLWILVERLTPPYVLKCASFVPPSHNHQRSARLNKDATCSDNPPGLMEHQEGTGIDSVTLSASPSHSEAKSHHRTPRVSHERQPSALRINDPAPPVLTTPFEPNAIGNKVIARALCETARDVFGCHVPSILFEELHTATPSMKLLFLTCVYNRLHAESHGDEALSRDTKGEELSPDTDTLQPMSKEQNSAKAVVKKDSTKKKPESSSLAASQRLQGSLFPAMSSSVTPSLLATPSLSVVRDAADEVRRVLCAEWNETLFHVFLKYGSIGLSSIASPSALAASRRSTEVVYHSESSDTSLSGDSGDEKVRNESTRKKKGDFAAQHVPSRLRMSFLAAELLVRDACFVASTRGGDLQPQHYTADDASAISLAVRKAFADTLRVVVAPLEPTETAAAGADQLGGIVPPTEATMEQRIVESILISRTFVCSEGGVTSSDDTIRLKSLPYYKLGEFVLRLATLLPQKVFEVLWQCCKPSNKQTAVAAAAGRSDSATAESEDDPANNSEGEGGSSVVSPPVAPLSASLTSFRTESKFSIVERIGIFLRPFEVLLKGEVVGGPRLGEGSAAYKSSNLKRRPNPFAFCLRDTQALRYTVMPANPSVWKDIAALLVPVFVKYSKFIGGCSENVASKKAGGEGKWKLLEERRINGKRFVELLASCRFLQERSPVVPTAASGTADELWWFSALATRDQSILQAALQKRVSRRQADPNAVVTPAQRCKETFEVYRLHSPLQTWVDACSSGGIGKQSGEKPARSKDLNSFCEGVCVSGTSAILRSAWYSKGTETPLKPMTLHEAALIFETVLLCRSGAPQTIAAEKLFYSSIPKSVFAAVDCASPMKRRNENATNESSSGSEDDDVSQRRRRKQKEMRAALSGVGYHGFCELVCFVANCVYTSPLVPQTLKIAYVAEKMFAVST